MLVILTRTVIIFTVLLLGMRFMGKRQIGELQPFEFVITLAIAELACTPMQDISIPIVYGLVPLLIFFVIHFFITYISTHSIKFRKLLNGKPFIIINENGIDIEALKQLNMNVNDLLESIRSQEYFSIEQVRFAIVETNGNVSILPEENARAPQSIPVSLIVEGKLIDENLKMGGVDKNKLNGYLTAKNLKVKDIVLMTIEGTRLLIQPKDKKYVVETIAEGAL